MSLLHLIVVLAVLGFVLWLVTTYVPMEPRIKQLLVIAVVIFLVIWLLQTLGLLAHLSSVRIQ